MYHSAVVVVLAIIEAAQLWQPDWVSIIQVVSLRKPQAATYSLRKIEDPSKNLKILLEEPKSKIGNSVPGQLAWLSKIPFNT